MSQVLEMELPHQSDAVSALDGSYTETLADFAASVRFEDLPPSAVHDTKRLILDTVASAVGSHFTDAGKIVVEVGRLRGGTPESTVLVTGEKTSCANASYVNGWLANCMDFDDIMCGAGGHFAQCAVFPALAMAERLGKSGRDMITAVAVGFEVVSRIGLALPKNARFNAETGKIDLHGTAGQTWAAFASAAACGWLLGFDGETMAHALGLAGYAAPIPTIGKWGATKGKWGRGAPAAGGLPMSKYTNYGALAEAGVMGALLADRGMTGDRVILDGDMGFWKMVGNTSFDFERLIRDLGKSWNVSETSLKRYPQGRELHQSLGLFEKLMRDNDLKAEDIDELTVRLLPRLKDMLGHFSIHNQIDTQMSLPYGLAMLALGYVPGPEWQNPVRFTDPDVVAFANKITVLPYPEGDQRVRQQQAAGTWKGERPCEVEIKAKGKVYSGFEEYAPGDPWLPAYKMSDDEIAQKFRNLATGLLRTDRIEQAIDTIYTLETVEHIDTLVRCLV